MRDRYVCVRSHAIKEKDFETHSPKYTIYSSDYD